MSQFHLWIDLLRSSEVVCGERISLSQNEVVEKVFACCSEDVLSIARKGYHCTPHSFHHSFIRYLYRLLFLWICASCSFTEHWPSKSHQNWTESFLWLTELETILPVYDWRMRSSILYRITSTSILRVAGCDRLTRYLSVFVHCIQHWPYKSRQETDGDNVCWEYTNMIQGSASAIKLATRPQWLHEFFHYDSITGQHVTVAAVIASSSLPWAALDEISMHQQGWISTRSIQHWKYYLKEWYRLE
jgi:hypothetical protein